MKIDLTGKTALVCGSTQGIGRAVASQFANSGATVLLLARTIEKLKETAQSLETPAGQRHQFFQADFSDSHSLERAIRLIVNEFPAIHILLNNSGGPAPGPIRDATPEMLESAFKQHVTANQLLTQALIPGMKELEYGRILNIISTSVKSPIPGLGVSNTIRGAVASWSKTLASEIAAYGITVNNILPGFTDTARLDQLFENNAKKSNLPVDDYRQKMKESIPANRIGTPEEIGYLATFLASNYAGYITGTSILIDGGRTNCL